MYDTMGSDKVNLIIRATTMGMLIQEFGYTNPKKNNVHPHVFRSNGPLQDSVCDHLIYLDAVFTRFPLPIMQISTDY